MIPEFLTAAEVAAFLRVHPRTILRLAQDGRIPAMRLSKQWRFRRDRILEWMDGQIRSSVSGVPTEVDPEPLAEGTTIHSLLRPAKMQMTMKATAREEALQELVGLLDAAGLCPDARELYRKVLDRENLCSTGLQHGVAIPHPGQAVPGLIRRTVIAFGRSLSGLDFGAIDGKPSRLFFLVCASYNGDHLKILSRLAHLCRDAGFCGEVLAQDDPEGVIRVLRECAEREGLHVVTAPFGVATQEL